MVFRVMYGCKSWTIKKAECRRIYAFELWCWRRLLKVPCTARISNQSILKEISPEYIHWKDWCWSWNSNTLATWFEELTHLKRPWCWEWLKAGGEGDNREWDGWMASWTQWIWVWVNSGSWWWTGRPGVHGVAESDTTEWLNWTESTSNRWDSSQGFWESASQITILSLARIKFLLFFLHWLLNFHWLLSHCFIDCWVLRGL